MEHTQGRRPVFELEEEREAAKIKVIGLGGGGSNAVNRMMAASFTGVDFIVGNTDLQALRSSPAPVKLQLGTRTIKDVNDPFSGAVVSAPSNAPTVLSREETAETLMRQRLETLARRYMRDLRRTAFVDVRV